MRTPALLFAAALWGAGLLSAAPAAAQAPDTDAFKAFVASPTHRDLVMRGIATVPASILPRCPALVSTTSRVIAMQTPAFAPNGLPNAGAWKEEFPVSGCGPATVVNLFFSAKPTGEIDVVAGMLGTTRADPRLQRDAVPFARLAAGRVTSLCPTLEVAHAEFERMGRRDGTPPAEAPPGKQPWWETWTLTGCGHAVEVPIEFVPDATGTQIIQSGGVTVH